MKKPTEGNLTLQDIKVIYTVYVLEKCRWKRGEAMKILKISSRTLNIYIFAFEKKYQIDIPRERETQFVKRLFPTNKERLAHLDWFMNKWAKHCRDITLDI